MQYAGKPLAEIAGYDLWQLRWVLCRPRDAAGKLLRQSGLPPWVEVDRDGMRVVRNPVPLAEAFGQVQRRRGLTREQTAAAWARWMRENPNCGRANLG